MHELNCYRTALRALMESKKERFGLRFTYEGMAGAAGVQKSYLSRVLKGSGHLNADQLYEAGRYLKLRSHELEYLEALQQWERCQVAERKYALQKRIDRLRARALETERSLNVQSDQSLAEFYIHPHAEMIHAGLTIRRFQENPDALRVRLNLSEQAWTDALELLDRLRLLNATKRRLVATELNHHLQQDHPVRRSHTLKKRVDALRALSERRDGAGYEFSAIFSASPKARQRVRQKLLEALKAIHEEVQASEAEEVYQLNIDLFSWTEQGSV